MVTWLFPVTSSYSPVPLIRVVKSCGTASTVAFEYCPGIITVYSYVVGLNLGLNSQKVPVLTVIFFNLLLYCDAFTIWTIYSLVLPSGAITKTSKSLFPS